MVSGRDPASLPSRTSLCALRRKSIFPNYRLPPETECVVCSKAAPHHAISYARCRTPDISTYKAKLMRTRICFNLTRITCCFAVLVRIVEYSSICNDPCTHRLPPPPQPSLRQHRTGIPRASPPDPKRRSV